jgi:hypothetical protein
MANLFKWEAGKYGALMRLFAERLTIEDGEKLLQNPNVVDRMVAALRTPDGDRPYHGCAERNHEGETYHVFVDYQMPRDKDELEAEFSNDGVSELFYGNYEWQLHSSCQGIDQAPGEREFLVKHFDRPIESDEAIAEMDKLGYRPATHLEAYAFAKANPELQRQFWIVALGSFTVCGGGRGVVVLVSGSGGRVLSGGWFGDRWGAGGRFLFVRKASS